MREDIDKMHAYRDAIGQVIDTDFQRILKSAVVLFPAQVDPAYQTHAFYTSLSHGIGGLPLLPGDANTLSDLKEYIKETYYCIKNWTDLRRSSCAIFLFRYICKYQM